MAAYRRGQLITCPECGEEAVVAVKTEMDGWTKVGEYFACGFCGARLADVEADPVETGRATRAPDRSGRLSEFLGTTLAPKKEVIADDGERRFCRDCKHFVEHPFHTRCLYHDRDVNPMDDCPDFERKTMREAEEETSGEDQSCEAR